MTATCSKPVHPPVRTLMGPGPSDVAPSVLAALAAPTVGHLDPYFLQIMDEVQTMLRQVFQTENQMTMAISGTGSAGMETCVVNLLEPGDSAVICQNGVFGGRMADVAERVGANVTKLERPFGEVFSTEEIAAAVSQHKPKVVGIVHAETSTGALQPLEEISRVVHDAGALLLVDCVTSLGGPARGNRQPEYRRRLQRDTKMSQLSARIVSSHLQPEGSGSDGCSKTEGIQLVSRHQYAS